MAATKVLYALRIPIDLKRLLDSAARSGGVSTSQLVIDACWKYLNPAQPTQAIIEHHEPLPAMNAAMAQFMAAAIPTAEPEAVEERPMCPYKEYDQETGETYACGLHVHSSKIRHTRGRIVT